MSEPQAPPAVDTARSTAEVDSGGRDLVDVTALDSTLVLDIRYATPRNFTGRILYPVARCLLHADVAERLVRVSERLGSEGLRLRIFDCYRPRSIQRELWALVPDERYVADPEKGSRHNRAAAVDLTLADASGAPLPMPSEYDDFTEKAHRDYGGGTAERRANRTRLERAMAEEGFVGLPTEWWHFDAPGWERYPLLDVPLGAAPSSSRASVEEARRAWARVGVSLVLAEPTGVGGPLRGGSSVSKSKAPPRSPRKAVLLSVEGTYGPATLVLEGDLHL